MTHAFIAVGSNINPAFNVREALRRLGQFEAIVGISTVYRTPAQGRPEQPPYDNCVIEIKTKRRPRVLKFRILRCIENELGRTRGEDKFAARTIDLDLIWYGQVRMKMAGLVLPDPDIAERPFLAVPLCQLAPELVFPDSGLRICDVAKRLPLKDMRPLKTYTDMLRRELDIHERVWNGSPRTSPS
jgi:2-amino-4-hydroxy-6-hydroxymethyldihydropteridine diphosphokinase